MRRPSYRHRGPHSPAGYIVKPKRRYHKARLFLKIEMMLLLVIAFFRNLGNMAFCLFYDLLRLFRTA